MDLMHKLSYTSGFLYHPPSEQILLQQYSSESNMFSPWLLFGETFYKKDSPEVTFKNLIFRLLNVKIEIIYLVYSYPNKKSQRDQHIFYSEIEKIHNFPSKNGINFGWFSFKEVLKIKAAEQTKHDIVVGQRVINAATRKRLGLHTFQ